MILNYEKGAPPLYFQLAKILQGKIEYGEYSPGDLLPTEKDLIEKYSVSRTTVRQAFDELSKIGYIKSRRGVGTKVIYQKIDERLTGVTSLTEEMKQHGIIMHTSYCHMEKIIPGRRIADALNIPHDTSCYRLSRVRTVRDTPLVYTVTFLKDITELPLEPDYYMESLYQYLRDAHGIQIESGQDTLEACLPGDEMQHFLQISADMPVFKRTRQTFIRGGEPFEYSVCCYPGNRYQYTVDL